MSQSSGKLDNWAALRQKAEAHLRDGTSPTNYGGVIGPDALQLLYRLASNSETSSDALKLLHELQAHQVELDMQQAQLEANERAMEQELLRYRALFDQAPVAYIVLDASGRLIEANRSARALLDRSPAAVDGGALQEHFVRDDREQLTALLTRIRSGRGVAPCQLRMQCGSEGEQLVRVLPAIGDGGEAILIALVALDNAPANA